MRPAALVLLALGACTVDAQVLVAPDGATPVASCAEAFDAPRGSACEAGLRCNRPLASDPECCQEIFLCESGRLVIDQLCPPGCRCVDDRECRTGASICSDEHCVSCPPPELCPPCAPPFRPLLRNGCPTCICAPPSQCSEQDPACASPETCYSGELCVEGCAPGDPGCCANVCAQADPPCPPRAPLGCKMPCDPGASCSCIAVDCECVAGAWSCTPGCSRTSPSCEVPPPNAGNP